MLEDANPGVQEYARDALAAMGSQAIPQLEPLLDRDEPALRLHAAIAILASDNTHVAATRELVEFVTSVGNVALSQQARNFAIELGAPVVPKLSERLSDSYPPVRVQVIQTLAGMKHQASPAIDRTVALINCL